MSSAYEKKGENEKNSVKRMHNNLREYIVYLHLLFVVNTHEAVDETATYGFLVFMLCSSNMPHAITFVPNYTEPM